MGQSNREKDKNLAQLSDYKFTEIYAIPCAGIVKRIDHPSGLASGFSALINGNDASSIWAICWLSG
jgi:hypothetical protein